MILCVRILLFLLRILAHSNIAWLDTNQNFKQQKPHSAHKAHTSVCNCTTPIVCWRIDERWLPTKLFETILVDECNQWHEEGVYLIMFLFYNQTVTHFIYMKPKIDSELRIILKNQCEYKINQKSRIANFGARRFDMK